MAPMSEAERRDFWEICEDRYQTRSTILTSQLPVARWHEQIGDPTAADGILDRLVHNAHRIDMRGDSMRKKRGPQPSTAISGRRPSVRFRESATAPAASTAYCLLYSGTSRGSHLRWQLHSLRRSRASKDLFPSQLMADFDAA